jgi:predicted small secreted protein
VSLEEFFVDVGWGSKVEREVRRRIKLSIAAYAYEVANNEIMSDAEFDKMCLAVDLKVDTGNKLLDSYFKENFDPSTGQWIHKHPELDKIANLYRNYYETG